MVQPSSQTNEEKLVSRKEMQEGLMGCMVATPAFAPFCLPLIFDKLDSGWSEGRIDALECFVSGRCSDVLVCWWEVWKLRIGVVVCWWEVWKLRIGVMVC